MILDIKWEIPENGQGEARLMALVTEVAGWDDTGVPHSNMKAEWEEVRVEIKKPNVKAETSERSDDSSPAPCSAWVAFLSDGERAFPVCTARSETEARDEGRRLVGHKDAYFISVHQVPNKWL